MSAIPAARRYVLAQLGELETFQGVDLLDSWRADYGHEAVGVLGPLPGETSWVSVGRGLIDLKFTLLVKIEVGEPGAETEETEDRADILLDAVLDLCANDPMLGGTLNKIPVKPILREWVTIPDGEGMKTIIDLGLECEVRR